MPELQVEKKEDLSHSKGAAAIVEIWTKELENSDKKEKNWRDEAEKNFDIYIDNPAEGTENRYNVFWSNTQTLRPLVFSKLPEPNITPNFSDKDEITNIASEMIERALKVQMNHSNTEDVIGKCRDDFLIGGRGVARVVYDPEDILEIKSKDGEVEEEIDPSTKKCRIEYVPWKDFRMSTENEWIKIRWVAFRHYKTRDELVRDFGKKGKTVDLNMTRLDSLDAESVENDLLKMAEVWEIWDKDSGKALFLTTGSGGVLLSEEEDPYELQGFFPMPEPLGSKSNPNSLIPVPLYRMYKSQAEELNIVDIRIKSLIEQCKATGIYNSIAEQADMKALFGGADGDMAPMKSTGQLKIQDVVMFKPLQEIILTIRELQQHKIEIINSIRDITGISDIVRGVTAASETATAQELKGNFAISRIQPLQKEIEFWSRDLLRLKTELLVENYSIDELVEMTNLKIVDIKTIAANAKERLKLLTMEAESNISPEDPEADKKREFLQQQAEKGFKETLKGPIETLKGYAATPEQLQEIEKVITNDKLRAYSIDVETDSTIRVDQQQEKQERFEYITAISNFSSAFFPLVQSEIISKDAFNQFLIFISKSYKVGRTIEENLIPDDNEEEKGPSAEEMLAQAEIQLEQQKLQLEQQRIQSETNLKQQEIDIKKAHQLFEMERHNDNLEFEDVNKQADREAKRGDEVIKARTELTGDIIRESNKPADI
jgi:hypothetical protein